MVPHTALANPQVAANNQARFAPQAQAAIGDFIHEEALNAETLLRLFRQAFMPVESVSSQVLMLTAESGMRLSVLVDADRRHLVLRTRYSLRPEAPMAAKLDFAHRANLGVIAVRFAIESPDTLQADFTLSFKGGVVTLQVMEAVRLMSVVVRGTIRDYDRDGVVA
jgi:hypothetical protein